MFQNCIRCTICVENCSVFGINPLFPGPKQSGPDAQRFRLDGEVAVDDWVKYCCQCKRCEMSCPHGVDIAEIILHAQIRQREGKKGTLASTLFTHNYLMGKFASFSAPIANKLAATKWARNLSTKFGISTYLPFPEFRFFSLERGLRKSLNLFGRRNKKVAFFYGCFLNFNRPDIGRKIRNLLIAMGLEVVLPPQTCCGLPALGNANLGAARRYAERNVDTLSPYIDAGYDIVYSCTSCGLALTNDYPGILNIPGGKKIAENSYNIYEYMLNLVEEGSIVLNLGDLKKKVAYHIPCHLRALGIGYPASRILSFIPGLETTIVDDHCCGLSGSYGFKSINQSTSQAIGEKAANAVIRTGADAVIADCGACRMQLAHMTGLPALDPVELLTESLQNAGIPLTTSSLFMNDIKNLQQKMKNAI